MFSVTNQHHEDAYSKMIIMSSFHPLCIASYLVRWSDFFLFSFSNMDSKTCNHQIIVLMIYHRESVPVSSEKYAHLFWHYESFQKSLVIDPVNIIFMLQYLKVSHGRPSLFFVWSYYQTWDVCMHPKTNVVSFFQILVYIVLHLVDYQVEEMHIYFVSYHNIVDLRETVQWLPRKHVIPRLTHEDRAPLFYWGTYKEQRFNL